MARKKPTPPGADVPSADEVGVVIERAADDASAAPDPDPEPVAPIAEEAPPETLPEAEIVLSEPPRPGPAPLGEPAAATPPVAREDRPRRGGFWGSVVGGIVAAGLGAGAVLYLLPEGWAPKSADPALAALEATVQSQADGIAALGERVKAAEAAAAAVQAPDMNALRSDLLAALPAAPDLTAITGSLDGLTAKIADLESRVAALEARPAGTGGDGAASAALAADVAALRDELAAQKAAVESALAEAAATAEAARKAQEAAAAEAQAAADRIRTADGQAAVSVLRAAVETGAPLQPAFDAMTAAGLTVPEDLRAFAAGVPTLTELRQSFPDMARAALAASAQVPAEGSVWDRAVAFFQGQTHARSLTPREGSSTDAVLSRIEAALAEGDIAMVIAKMSALPEPAREAMAPWIDRARALEQAQRALKSLSAAEQ